MRYWYEHESDCVFTWILVILGTQVKHHLHSVRKDLIETTWTYLKHILSWVTVGHFPNISPLTWPDLSLCPGATPHVFFSFQKVLLIIKVRQPRIKGTEGSASRAYNQKIGPKWRHLVSVCSSVCYWTGGVSCICSALLYSLEVLILVLLRKLYVDHRTLYK